MSVSHSHDTLAAVLELIVSSCAPVVETVLDEVVDKARSFHLIHQASFWKHPLLQISNEVLAQLEAWQVILSEEHHLYQLHYFVCMLLESHEPKSHLFSVLAELLAPDSSQYLNHLSSQLEWCLFEFNSLSRSIGQEETEVDVHNMSFDINHDISIVAILNLKDIADKTVGGQ